jgi:hypothetical protein
MYKQYMLKVVGQVEYEGWGIRSLPECLEELGMENLH